MSTTIIRSFEVLDHGVDHSQYFQGCGTAFTQFDHAFTGIGDSEHAALEDALEQLATSGYTTGLDAGGKLANLDALFAADLAAASKETSDGLGDECHHHVSIRIAV